MKRARYSLALCLLGMGCSGKRKADAGTLGVSCAAKPAACTLPPAPGNEPPNKSGTPTVIAISKLFIDPDQGKWLGYNLDGLISKLTDRNHCTLQKTGPTSIWAKTDGDGGIDNSFGANVTPLVDAFGPGTPDQGIAGGKATVLFRLDNLVDADKTPDQNGITGAIYEGADKGSAAAFDGTDVWPVSADSVNGSVNAPRATFSGSYVAGGIWVSHGKPDLVLPLVTESYALELPIHRAIITMRIHGTGKNATAVDGVIAGVIDTELLVQILWKEAVAVAPSLCTDSYFDGIAGGIRASSDIMFDETNGDPAKTCNAISIGVGFTGTAAALGTVAPPQPAPPRDPCAAREAGAPDGGPSDAGAK